MEPPAALRVHARRATSAVQWHHQTEENTIVHPTVPCWGAARAAPGPHRHAASAWWYCAQAMASWALIRESAALRPGHVPDRHPQRDTTDSRADPGDTTLPLDPSSPGYSLAAGPAAY